MSGKFAAGSAKLALCNISLRNNTRSSLQLTLRPGVYGLLGPNGCGKTTLLQYIAGIQTAPSGEVIYELGGRRLQSPSYKERLGYVPQNFSFYEEMAVHSYLLYTAKMRMIPPGLIKPRIEEVSKWFGLENMLPVPIRKLSTGHKRRLMLAQALLADPHFLLLDEPLEGLDLEERGMMLSRLRQIAAAGSIVLLASQIVAEAEEGMEEVMFLDNGTIAGPRPVDEWKWKLEGKVWEGYWTGSLQDWKRSLQIALPPEKMFGEASLLSYRVLGNQVAVRLCADYGQEPDDRKFYRLEPVEPTLEDVYLWFYARNVMPGISQGSDGL